VVGEKPYSATRITTAIVIVVALIAVLVIAVMLLSR
jgi:hypothetical protein